MPGILSTFAADVAGLRRVCGTRVALRWGAAAVSNYRDCLRRRSLAPADIAMGDGPFHLRHRTGARASALGPNVLTGVREMWVRDGYLADDYLTVPPGGTIVDLGANRGLFTLLALGTDPGVRVVAVEAARPFIEVVRRNLALNDWTDRAQVCDRFIGGETHYQASMRDRPDYAVTEAVSVEDFLMKYRLERIDLLKCDIEGSEFGLLKSGSPLLAITRQLAVEIHDVAGDRESLLSELRSEGFEVRALKTQATSCVAQAKRSSHH